MLIGQHLLQPISWTTNLSRLIHSRRDNSSWQVQVSLMYLKNTLVMLLHRSIKPLMLITPMIIWKNAIIYSLIFCLSINRFQLLQQWYLSNQLQMVWNPQIWCMPLALGLTPIWRSNWRKIIQTTIQMRRNLASWDLLLTIITNSMIIPAAPNQLLEITRSQLCIATLPQRL